MENADQLPRCGIVILNWCSAEDTVACSRAIVASTYPNLEIVVVDNASPDNSYARMSTFVDEYDSAGPISLLRTERNLGYAGGNNYGIEVCLERGCEFILVLNNDTVVAPHAVSELIQYAARVPRAGLIGACLVDYDDPMRVQCLGGAMFNPWLLRTTNLSEGATLADTDGEATPDYISGACVLVRREFLEQVGMMREDLFLYGEELDWVQRGKQLGWGHAVCRGAVVRHRWTPDEPARRARANYYFVRNGLTLLRAYYPMALVSACMTQVLRGVALCAVGRRDDAVAIAKGLWGFLSGHTGEQVI
jgi:hypothetical protein